MLWDSLFIKLMYFAVCFVGVILAYLDEYQLI